MVDSIPACSCGANRELRRRSLSNGAVVAYLQCPACGLAHSAPSRGLDLERLEPFDETLRERIWQSEQVARARDKEALAAKRRDAYEVYLGSDEWFAIRRQVLARDPLCQGCRQQRSTQVHHLTYAHLGNELLFELVGLCENCHAQAHSVSRFFEAGERGNFG
jgi:5-methylcytosine-specific restriction endonuclease McrA